MKSKGPKAQKTFWELIGGSKKRKLGIDTLEVEGKIVSNQEDKNKEVERFFIKKFKATIDPENVPPGDTDDIDASKLGIPKRVLTNKDSLSISQEITFEELKQNIQQLDSSKAEGEGGVTNSMLKNLPEAAEEKL